MKALPNILQLRCNRELLIQVIRRYPLAELSLVERKILAMVVHDLREENIGKMDLLKPCPCCDTYIGNVRTNIK